MARKNRIQALLINYLEKFGDIDLLLPDGVTLQIGVTQESKHGRVKSDNYCWVMTNRDDRATLLDRYTMSVRYGKGNYVVDDAEGTVDFI